MEGSVANTNFRQSWNNLVDLPANLTSLLYNANVSPQEVIIELVLQTQQKSYVGWSGMSSNAAKTIGIDPIFAHSLKLADKQHVTVNLKIRNHKTSSVFLEPENSSDWELVELHAAYIEAKLIEQSRCVALNQVLVVYPTKTSSVRLQVRDIGTTAVSYALIDPFAEISIAPKLKEKKKPSSSVKSARSTKSAHDEFAHGPSCLKRGISLPSSIFSASTGSANAQGYEIFINFDEILNEFQRAEYVSVSVVTGPNSKQAIDPQAQQATPLANGGKEKEKEKSTVITENRNIVAKLVNSPTAPTNTVGLSEKLAVALNVESKIGYKVVLKQAIKNVSKRPSTLIVHPYITQTKKVDAINLNSTAKRDQSAALVQNISKILFDPASSITSSPITNFMKIPIIPGYLPNGGLLTFKRNSDHLAWIKPYTLEGAKVTPKIEIGEDLLRNASFIQEILPVDTLDEAFGIDEKINDSVEYISIFRNSGMMFYGTPGSGKTLALQLIAKRLSDEHGFHTKFVSCESVMNESFDQLCNTFNKWVQECFWNEPSVLILDNLDKILSAEVEHSDSTVSNQLTECLISLLVKIHSQNKTNVSLLVSGASKEAFNKLLALSHLIESYVHLSAPEKAARADILEGYLIKKLGCKVDFDIMDIVLETEGYLPNDLKVLSDRIYHESLFQRSESEESIDEQNLVSKDQFEKALTGYMPSNLRGVKLQKSSTSWGDIGGLIEPKRVLLETLEWPTKYAPIFANCPLRLRSGILLYGFPGCGKTLLASAIAGQCGLNFISIKGPEILNKYIGASEQSVRELFDRAQSAKPCILFFDEFDSIAPKRGHDSTGVTDRVVNQMLTQMDGAEGLDGVYVLAATSRPDLIDSALLRPGRLDKSIICDMPTYEDRLDILKCICGKMYLNDDVDLEYVASKTGGFSGADMQGLGYNAYLKAVHEKLANDEDLIQDDDKESTTYDFFQVNAEKLKSKKLRPAEKMKLLQQIEKLFADQDSQSSQATKADKGDGKVVVTISQQHFLESLAETKPSISASEKTKLERIYSEFLTGRDGTMPDGSASNDIGGRTTLM